MAELHHVADSHRESVGLGFIAAVEYMQNRVSVAEIEQAFRLGQLSLITAMFSEEVFTQVLHLTMDDSLDTIVAEAAESGKEDLPPEAQVLGIAGSNMEDRLDTQVDFTIAGLAQNTSLGVNRLAAGLFALGIGASAAARLIHAGIGMEERQANAVVNLIGANIDEIGEAAAVRAAGNSIAGHISHRAVRIANSESIRMETLGRLGIWEVAAEVGFIPNQKRWFTVEDDMVCEFCEPMNGQTVEFGRQFISPQGLGAVDGPPLHPNCRCTVELVR